MKVKFIAIAALGRNRKFGQSNKNFWVNDEVHKSIFQTIKKQYVILDDLMLEEMGGDVEGAYPLVLTQNPNYSNKNALIFKKIEDILYYVVDAELEQVFILGGVQTFSELLPFVSDFHWYEIQADEGEAPAFPDFSSFQWNKVANKNNKEWSFHHLIKAPQKIM